MEDMSAEQFLHPYFGNPEKMEKTKNVADAVKRFLGDNEKRKVEHPWEADEAFRREYFAGMNDGEPKRIFKKVKCIRLPAKRETTELPAHKRETRNGR